VKDNKIELNYTLKIKDKLWELNSPKVMGILNLTPDSFFSGSRVQHFDALKSKVEEMVIEGADLLDIGGVSTRPGADLLSAQEEIDRVGPMIVWISETYPEIPISIDTFRSEVAELAVKNGASIVNDVYGGRYDQNMFSVVGKLDVPYILMHSRGDASNMQQLTHYNHFLKDVIKELSKDIQYAINQGVNDIIIDPGFGFAKSTDQNFKLLNHMDHFRLFDLPILAGISRKSMIYKSLQITPEEALNGTSILNTIALQKGASILRVHDVKEAKEACKLVALTHKT